MFRKSPSIIFENNIEKEKKWKKNTLFLSQTWKILLPIWQMIPLWCVVRVARMYCVWTMRSEQNRTHPPKKKWILSNHEFDSVPRKMARNELCSGLPTIKCEIPVERPSKWMITFQKWKKGENNTQFEERKSDPSFVLLSIYYIYIYNM